jgi:hypothetical protein
VFRITIEGPRSSPLFFNIRRDGELVHSTEDSLLWELEKGTKVFRIEFDLPPQERTLSELTLDSYEEFLASEQEILERIASIPNGGQLYLLHPFLLLADVGIKLTDRAKSEILREHEGLSSVSPTPYQALMGSQQTQSTRFRIRSLSRRGSQ